MLECSQVQQVGIEAWRADVREWQQVMSLHMIFIMVLFKEHGNQHER
jgi:hypothetical protein